MTPQRVGWSVAFGAAVALGALGGSVWLAGCADRQPATPPPRHGWKQPWQSEKPLPPWIADPTRGGTVIGAWGSADQRSGESRAEQRDRAMASARAELSRMLRVRIRTAVRDYLADSGSAVIAYSEAVSRQVSDETLAGSYQRDEFVNEKTGELFVWVVVDATAARDLARQLGQTMVSMPSGDRALDAHLQAKMASDSAFRELDRLLERSSSERP